MFFATHMLVSQHAEIHLTILRKDNVDNKMDLLTQTNCTVW